MTHRGAETIFRVVVRVVDSKLFYGNYPGGSGLIAGTVFGRIAGDSAARRAREIG